MCKVHMNSRKLFHWRCVWTINLSHHTVLITSSANTPDPSYINSLSSSVWLFVSLSFNFASTFWHCLISAQTKLGEHLPGATKTRSVWPFSLIVSLFHPKIETNVILAKNLSPWTSCWRSYEQTYQKKLYFLVKSFRQKQKKIS